MHFHDDSSATREPNADDSGVLRQRDHVVVQRPSPRKQIPAAIGWDSVSEEMKIPIARSAAVSMM